MNTREQDAIAYSRALGHAMYYAKRLDDHDAVKALIPLGRRLERQFPHVVMDSAFQCAPSDDDTP